jgi:hypothetical protein
MQANSVRLRAAARQGGALGRRSGKNRAAPVSTTPTQVCRVCVWGGGGLCSAWLCTGLITLQLPLLATAIYCRLQAQQQQQQQQVFHYTQIELETKPGERVNGEGRGGGRCRGGGPKKMGDRRGMCG